MLAAQTMCPITTKFVEIRITLNNLPLKRLPNLSNSYPKHHTEYIYIYISCKISFIQDFELHKN